MKNKIKIINISNLHPHPDNPNRMSKDKLRKLKRHIEQFGRYEPIIIRPKTRDHRQETNHCRERENQSSVISTGAKRSGEIHTNGSLDCARDNNERVTPDTIHKKIQYEILNGHHRVEVLKELGYEKCDCIIWNVDDDEARILLATLNGLSGNDILEKKMTLLTSLNKKFDVKELSKLLPNTKTQIQRLVELNKKKPDIKIVKQKIELPFPITFFLTREQKQTVEDALEDASSVGWGLPHHFKRCGGACPTLQKDNSKKGKPVLTKANRNALAITQIAKEYLKQKK